MNLQTQLLQALELAAAAKPSPELWSGPASSAIANRLELLVADLTALNAVVAQFESSHIVNGFWSSASLLN